MQNAIAVNLKFGMFIIFKPMSCLEPEAAVTDCWAKGAVPKVASATLTQSLEQVDIDVLGSGDASVSAALSRPVSQAKSVFTVTVLL